MGQKILIACKKKGAHLNFPFPSSEFQVQEIMNAEEPETKIYNEIMEGKSEVASTNADIMLSSYIGEEEKESSSDEDEEDEVHRKLIDHEDENELISVRSISEGKLDSHGVL